MNNFGDMFADPIYPPPSHGHSYGGDFFPDPKNVLLEFMTQETPRYLLEIHVSFITYRVRLNSKYTPKYFHNGLTDSMLHVVSVDGHAGEQALPDEHPESLRAHPGLHNEEVQHQRSESHFTYKLHVHLHVVLHYLLFASRS
ncbi:hypothetical protein EON65_45015 [archaeon]|nr:MAG: hypothetical protein EON65_45015 [archaeon]